MGLYLGKIITSFKWARVGVRLGGGFDRKQTFGYDEKGVQDLFDYYPKEEKMAKSNSEIWPVVKGSTASGQSIRNWTSLKGYLGDNFKIVKVRDNSLEVETPNARTIIHVRREDFEGVWEVWTDYKSGKVQRQELIPITRNSKYVISILHWMETEK